MKKMDLKSKEPLLDTNLNPSADNSNTALSAFYQKKIYELKSFELPYIGDNKPINFLYEKQFYGRINLLHDTVITDVSKLKSMLGSKAKEIKLHNFVFDAYKEFISYWDYLKKINKVSSGGLLQIVNAKTSYLDPGKNYYYYINSLYKDFNNVVLLQKIKIKSFNDFVDEFIKYVDSVSPYLPILFSSYVGSRMADPLISGLCFDVNDSLDSSNDQLKYDKFLQDPNFPLFKKTAMKFGFFVDKQIPWRLWADIDSPAMKPYMDIYEITQDNIYDKNYVVANNYDLQLLRFYLLQFYNTYVFSNGNFKEPDFKICEKTGITIINYKEFNIEKIEHQNTLTLEYDRFFMKLYVYIKMRENNYNWDKSKFENIVANFVQLKEALDMNRAMRYISPLVKIPAVSEKIPRNFTFR